MSNKKHSSGLNFLFPSDKNTHKERSDTLSDTPLIGIDKTTEYTKDTIHDLITFSDYNYRSKQQEDPKEPYKITETPDFTYNKKKTPSSRSLKASFKGLHPFAQSSIARLTSSADNSFEFYQLYQSMLDSSYKLPSEDKSSYFRSNILMLKGLSTLLEGKIVSLPLLPSGSPSLHKNKYSKLTNDWQIVDCTDESLDVSMPRVKVVNRNDNLKVGNLFYIPLDVVFFFNKPY